MQSGNGASPGPQALPSLCGRSGEAAGGLRWDPQWCLAAANRLRAGPGAAALHAVLCRVPSSASLSEEGREGGRRAISGLRETGGGGRPIQRRVEGEESNRDREGWRAADPGTERDRGGRVAADPGGDEDRGRATDPGTARRRRRGLPSPGQEEKAGLGGLCKHRDRRAGRQRLGSPEIPGQGRRLPGARAGSSRIPGPGQSGQADPGAAARGAELLPGQGSRRRGPAPRAQAAGKETLGGVKVQPMEPHRAAARTLQSWKCEGTDRA
ncbi:hypothetical protein NDU88_002381 [Pleurodeles waltl]|uniref:Uncharacterized protein n=1 Tax=Pleurodeles waltl TaxID=8319 RepID=A0AAV7T2E0_PLEWA|nr:hypothetical protein NDU88_002381 [Pleurodeles waltl]